MPSDNPGLNDPLDSTKTMSDFENKTEEFDKLPFATGGSPFSACNVDVMKPKTLSFENTQFEEIMSAIGKLNINVENLSKNISPDINNNKKCEQQEFIFFNACSRRLSKILK